MSNVSMFEHFSCACKKSSEQKNQKTQFIFDQTDADQSWANEKELTCSSWLTQIETSFKKDKTSDRKSSWTLMLPKSDKGEKENFTNFSFGGKRYEIKRELILLSGFCKLFFTREMWVFC